MIELEMNGGDLSKLNSMINALTGKEVHAAIAAATRRTATMARTEAWRQIHSIYTIKQKDVYARTKITRANADGEVTLKVRGGFEPLSKYRYRVRKKTGITAIVKKGKGTVVPRSFLYNGRPMRREGAPRLPIQGLYEPAVPQLFGNPEVLDRIEQVVNENLPARLEHELERRLFQ